MDNKIMHLASKRRGVFETRLDPGLFFSLPQIPHHQPEKSTETHSYQWVFRPYERWLHARSFQIAERCMLIPPRPYLDDELL
jgi:hypothetical protein